MLSIVCSSKPFRSTNVASMSHISNTRSVGRIWPTRSCHVALSPSFAARMWLNSILQSLALTRHSPLSLVNTEVLCVYQYALTVGTDLQRERGNNLQGVPPTQEGTGAEPGRRERGARKFWGRVGWGVCGCTPCTLYMTHP